MYRGFHEEGDSCPECHVGNLVYPPVENCSCHINPPCSACTDRVLVCDKCAFEPDEPQYVNVPVAPGLMGREYRPQPLDNRKIDYRIKTHTYSTMICEGVYPPEATMEDVRKVVNGTFGGRFERFGDGKFKFIAYTD